MRRRHISLGAVIWIVIGLVIAANHHLLKDLSTISHIATAIVAVILWPLLLLGVHIAI